MVATLQIVQGTDTSIDISNIRIDGVLTDITGWTVHAALRRDSQHGAVVAEWHTSPAGLQGQALPGNGTCRLLITPALSEPWSWSRGIVQAEATENVSPYRKARIIDRPVYLKPEVIT